MWVYLWNNWVTTIGKYDIHELYELEINIIGRLKEELIKDTNPIKCNYLL